MTLADFKHRALGAGNRIFTVLGLVMAALAGLSQYLDLIPQDLRGGPVYGFMAFAVGVGTLWAKSFPPGPLSTGKVPPSITPLVLLAAGSLLLAAPARAQDAQPSGLLPQAGTCSKSGSACLQPVLTVLPIVIDFKSGNVSRDVAFGFGYGLVFPKTSVLGLAPGVDLLGGTKTSGGWIAAVLPKLGAFRLGPVVTHAPGATYAGLGFGVGTP